jgi:protein-L-isoaspartate(D-aspartate) O-methyltransferase
MFNSQISLVQRLAEQGVIKTNSVIQAMTNIDRGFFVQDSSAYEDRPKQIGYKATISAPHMHGYALEWLKDHLIPGSKALDIGSGSGYLTLCMAEMMNYSGLVVGIDHIKELVNNSIRSINQCKPQALTDKIVQIFEADGRLGYPPLAPYKAIHVGAASEEIPQALVEQLDFGGRMVIPVGRRGKTQYIMLVDKDYEGKITINKDFGVTYIPLCDRSYQA